MDPEKPKSVGATFQMMECGDVAISSVGPIEKAIVIMGNSKAGKSTLLHIMAHSDLLGEKGDFSVIYKLRTENPQLGDVKIGYSEGDSETQIPNIARVRVGNEEAVVVDMPGFDDSYGCLRETSNRFFIGEVFKRAKEIKFVLVAPIGDLQRSADNFSKCVLLFLKNFQDYRARVDEICKHVTLVFTRAPKDKSEEDVRGRLPSIKMKVSADQPCYNKIIAEARQNNRIFLVPMAVENEQVKFDNIEVKIQNCMAFWPRKQVNGVVDMSPFRITISDCITLQQTTQKNQLANELKSLSLHLRKEEFHKNIFLIFKEIMNGLLAEVDEDTPLNFFNLAENFMKKLKEQVVKLPKDQKSLSEKYSERTKNLAKKFSNTNYNQSVSPKTDVSQKNVPLSLLKMKAFEKIANICKDFNSEAENKQNVSKGFNAFLQILKTLMQLFQRTNRNIQNFGFLCFSLQQKLDLLTEIYKIFLDSSIQQRELQQGSVNQGREVSDELREIVYELPNDIWKLFNLIDKKVWTTIVNYIRKIDIESFPANMNVYQQYKNFIGQVAVKIQKLKDIELETEGIKPSQRDDIISQFQLKLFKIDYKISELRKENNVDVLKQLEELRERVKNKSEQLDGQMYEQAVALEFQILHLMAAFAMDRNELDYAEKIYESINDAHNVLAICKKKEVAIEAEKRNTEKLLTFEIGYMTKAYGYGRVELAIEKCHYAISLAQKSSNVLKIKQLAEAEKWLMASISVNNNLQTSESTCQSISSSRRQVRVKENKLTEEMEKSRLKSEELRKFSMTIKNIPALGLVRKMSSPKLKSP